MILAKKYSLPSWRFLLCLFTILCISCAEKEFHEFSGKTMGTDYTIKYAAKLPNQSNNKDKVDEYKSASKFMSEARGLFFLVWWARSCSRSIKSFRI